MGDPASCLTSLVVLCAIATGSFVARAVALDHASPALLVLPVLKQAVV